MDEAEKLALAGRIEAIETVLSLLIGRASDGAALAAQLAARTYVPPSVMGLLPAHALQATAIAEAKHRSLAAIGRKASAAIADRRDQSGSDGAG